MRKQALVPLLASVVFLTCCVTTAGETPQSEPNRAVAAQTDSVSVATENIDWLSPIANAEHNSAGNQFLSQLLYQPLFSFSQTSEANYKVDTVRSIGAVSAVSPDGMTFTVDLHNRTWSDGTPITTNDIALWWQLVNDNRDALAGTGAADLIDATARLSVTSDKSFTLTTATKFNPNVYVSNYLAYLIPLPAHAWEDESGDTQTLFQTLSKAGGDPSNELWKTTSGSYTLQANTLSGPITLSANQAYDGLDKPKIATLNLLPNVEVTQAGNSPADVFFLPVTTSKEDIAAWETAGYKTMVQHSWGINYLSLNFNKSITDMYLREVLQLMIDQNAINKTAWAGYSQVGCGPVPVSSADPTQTPCKPEFDLKRARTLLTDHGWDLNTYPITCKDSEKCGPNYSTGSSLELTMLLEPGDFKDRVFPILKANFEEVGIELTAKEVPDVVAEANGCRLGTSDCDWDLGYFGAGASWEFPVYPTGEKIFTTDAVANFGGFSNPNIDENIDDTLSGTDEDAMATYESAIKSRRGYLWLPTPAKRLVIYKDGLEGMRTDTFLPQEWSYQ